MTPKEEAKELIVKMYKHIFEIDLGSKVEHDGKRLIAAKQCALVAVKEIIKVLSGIVGEFDKIKYWQEVKAEIEKL